MPATGVISEISAPKSVAMATQIIGLGCRFPESESPAAFWANLICGKDMVRRVQDCHASPLAQLDAQHLPQYAVAYKGHLRRPSMARGLLGAAASVRQAAGI